MNRSTILAAALVVGFLIAAAACTGNDDKDDKGKSSESTGIPELDAVILAVESHNVGSLRNLIEFQTVACTRELGAGGPPKCRDGEAQGTNVSVFAFGVCEPEWRRNDDVDDALRETVAIAPKRLAAFEPPAGFFVDGKYVAIFEGPDARVSNAFQRGVAVGTRNGRIVEIALACGAGATGASMIPKGQKDFLLAP